MDGNLKTDKTLISGENEKTKADGITRVLPEIHQLHIWLWTLLPQTES